MSDAALVLGVPLWTWSAHVVELGTIGIANPYHQLSPARGDGIQENDDGAGLPDQHGALSIANEGREAQHENLLANSIARMQDPVPPVFQAWRLEKGAHHGLGLLTGFDKIGDRGAATIDQNAFGMGAVEKD